MDVIVSGATGLVGAALTRDLAAAGHYVRRFVRVPSAPNSRDVFWDPDRGILDAGSLRGVEAAIHLAGESIASGRWTAAKKNSIRESRTRGTRLIAETLARVSPLPRVLLSASAVGYYGSRGSEVLTERSVPGRGFLAEVCRDWEAASAPAAAAGIRTVTLRFGVVLSPAGGMLAKVLVPFRLGLGGRVGDGEQFMSWIEIGDLVRVIGHALETKSLTGAVNAVSPHPATNREFTETLGRVLSRPTVFPVPAFAARIAFGEMADEMLLASTRVEPERLLDSGFVFRHPTLESALRHLLMRKS
jgi:uncharacterized protein (TIGR01777 family)